MDTKRPDWDRYFLQIALDISKRATCLRRSYGAVIVKDNIIVSTGYNGAPRGESNCTDNLVCKRAELGIPKGERYELCLRGDTLLKVPSGAKVTIKELAEEYARSVSMVAFGYSYDDRNKSLTRSFLISPFMSGQTDTLVCVHVQDGNPFYCTPEHKIMLSNGTYKEAKLLTTDDVLMGFMDENDVKYTTQVFISKIETVDGLKEDVYDLTVPVFHNFAIDLGKISIFVHNCRAVHAEMNAIINADPVRMKDATIYIAGYDYGTNNLANGAPCALCSKMIKNAQISKVVYLDEEGNVVVLG